MLLFSVSDLIWTDVPDEFLEENIRNNLTVILAAMILVYAFFSPYSGGIVLCIIAIIMNFIIDSQNWVLTTSGFVFLIGVSSIFRGRLSKKTAKESQKESS
jgi:ABC-type multidrug transport system fused ATPase/permease subunit